MPTIATEPIVKEVHVDAEPDTVFAFFTEADKITRWMAADATTDPRPGGINHQTLQSGGGVNYLLRGEFVELDPPRRVVFTWGFENPEMGVAPGSSTVEVTLTPADGGTHLRLVHSGLPERVLAGHDSGWDEQLGNLTRALAA
jgi:uncharacterized protein YndB with AHSA1/START domain